VVWTQLGDVDHYIEPFAGGLGVMLGRPKSHDPKSETVNDLDGFVVNAWRAIQFDPDALAETIEEWPISELDLHARNKWLIDIRQSGDLVDSLRADPEYADLEVAAWWLHGICAWSGGAYARKDSLRRPKLGLHGQGVHALCRRSRLDEIFEALSQRLRHVRICCGDWRRVCTDGSGGPVSCGSTVGIFLDPPYTHEGRSGDLYSEEMACADAVRDRALELGKSHDVRIALCGLRDEHDVPASWSVYEWSSFGFGTEESIWFSPGCLRGVEQRELL
jgi:DNA adenine methylase